MHGREAFDHHAVLFIHHAGLREVELVHLDLCAGVRQEAEAGLGVPGIGFDLARDEMLDAEARLLAGRAVDHERLDAAAGPAADPDLREVAHVVGVQMGGETGGDVLVRDFERGEVRLRAAAEIEDELVAVAELDQP